MDGTASALTTIMRCLALVSFHLQCEFLNSAGPPRSTRATTLDLDLDKAKAKLRMKPNVPGSFAWSFVLVLNADSKPEA